MTEPTIICPNCKTEIKLTESLAAPLIEATRKDYERRLNQKDLDIAKREAGLAVPPARTGDRRGVLLPTRRPRQREKDHHETVGQT